MISGSFRAVLDTKSKPSDDSLSRDEIAIMVARLTLTLTLPDDDYLSNSRNASYGTFNLFCETHPQDSFTVDILIEKSLVLLLLIWYK